MDFIRSTSEKMNLWPVEHFFPPFFFQISADWWKIYFYKKIHYKICKCCNFNQSALIWKKTGGKSVQLVRVSLFRKYFLWNPYFSSSLKSVYTFMSGIFCLWILMGLVKRPEKTWQLYIINYSLSFFYSVKAVKLGTYCT